MLTLLAGLAATRLDLPVLGEVEAPEPAGLGILPEFRDADVTGQVIVHRR